MNNEVSPLLSVVIPTFNEMQSGLFERVLSVFEGIDGVQIIVSDGGSADGTLDVAKQANAQVVNSNPLSRAIRINDGISYALGDMVLLNHPRSVLDPNGVKYLIERRQHLEWGGFTHRFDTSHPFLAFTSWYSNRVRARFGSVVYLDHCKFATRALLNEAGPIEPVDIFEDTILSQKLSKLRGRPVILPFSSTTSAIRFRKNGMLKQGLLNQWMKICFHLGVNHRRMNRMYEGDRGLNSRYKDRS